MLNWMRPFAAAAVASLLAACGGGGGSPGETHAPYQISLRADRTELPINIANAPPGMGFDAPYTTTLYVAATEDGRPIPGGEEVFACNLVGGLETGALYYLDGNPDHEKDGFPLAYRSITLGANSGAASFHFSTANDRAGVATIQCSVTDPRDLRAHTAAVDITVGGSARKHMPASAVLQAQAPGYLGTQFNQNGVMNNVELQATVRDDASQPVPDTTHANLQVAIVGQGAAQDGARLLWGADDSSTKRCTVPGYPGVQPCVWANTINGVAQVSLSSGPTAGVILLALTADRSDNDVTNGVADPITQLAAVTVVGGVPSGPLVFAGTDLGSVGRFDLIAQALEASGGLQPYHWGAVDPLPAGLDLQPSGVITGTITEQPGTYSFRVGVTDANGFTDVNRVALSVGASVPVVASASISTTTNTQFAQILTASGGQPPYRWSIVANDAGVRVDPNTGILSGTIGNPATYNLVVQVADQAGQTAGANITVTVVESKD